MCVCDNLLILSAHSTLVIHRHSPAHAPRVAIVERLLVTPEIINNIIYMCMLMTLNPDLFQRCFDRYYLCVTNSNTIWIVVKPPAQAHTYISLVCDINLAPNHIII